MCIFFFQCGVENSDLLLSCLTIRSFTFDPPNVSYGSPPFQKYYNIGCNRARKSRFKNQYFYVILYVHIGDGCGDQQLNMHG